MTTLAPEVRASLRSMLPRDPCPVVPTEHHRYRLLELTHRVSRDGYGTPIARFFCQWCLHIEERDL